VAHAIGTFDRLASPFAEALKTCVAELVLPLTTDASPSAGLWSALAAAAPANPQAVAFRLTPRGLLGDPAWRGRRVRDHERNLETLRFANLLAPGVVAMRREAALAASRHLGATADADWWRLLLAEIAAHGLVVSLAESVRRRRRLPAEPHSPGFAPPHGAQAGPAPSVLVFGQLTVSTSLYFDALQSRAGAAVRFRAPTRLAVDAPHLASADLVVLVRDLHRFHDEGVTELLERLGVPYVYFTDDNFQILRGEGLASRFYQPHRVRAALLGAAEVWASTAPLAEALRPLHPRVRAWEPVLDPVLAAPPSPRPGPLTIAFSGGDFRLPGFRGAPLERLRRLSRELPLRLLLTPGAARQLADELAGAEIIISPIEPSFRQFIYRWRAFGVDILLHPAGATANAPFKCPTAAITAGYLGAIPVVDDEPAYSGWHEADGLLRFGDDAQGLDDAVTAARDAARRARLGERLSASLARRFADAGRWQVLQTLAADRGVARPGLDILSQAGFRARRAALGIARRSRWLRDRASPRG
jgi:hypothetical protein